MNRTAIEWTDFTANPLKYRRKSDGKVVWGCVKTSPGCAHCYAETIALRFDRGKLFNAANMEELEPFLDESELRHMLNAKKIGGQVVAGSRCFVGDMTDVFGWWVPERLLDRLLAAFFLRSDVTWQVLTKRAKWLWEYLSHKNRAAMVQIAAFEMDHGYTDDRESHADWFMAHPIEWPLPNVWLGVSVENQHAADERIPHLLRTPAAVRFLSCEPLLSSLDLTRYGMCGGVNPRPVTRCTNGWLEDHENQAAWHPADMSFCSMAGIGWVIVGGESGHGARPMDVAWVRSIVEQCRASGVACFVKQLGSRPAGLREWCDRCNAQVPSRIMHGLDCDKSPVLRDRKGGDPSEWPEDLRVREFPAPR